MLDIFGRIDKNIEENLDKNLGDQRSQHKD